MDLLTPQEIQQLIARSVLVPKYSEVIDRESAFEILNKKIEQAKEQEPEPAKKATGKEEKGFWDSMMDNTVVKSMMRTAGNSIVRSLLGSLGVKQKRR
jgi:hypothetical protein